MDSSETLVLFTNEFPYGNGETFLETEIQYLATSFQTIYIIPNKAHFLNDSVRDLPSNVFIKTLFSSKKSNYFFFFIRHFKNVISSFLFSLTNERKKHLYLYHCFSYGRYLIDEMIKSKAIASFIREENLNNATFYTYWFLINNLALAFLIERKLIRGSFSRAHSYDLYDERQGGLIPFRPYKMKYIKKVFTVSHSGLQYLQARTNYYKKVDCIYLGTNDYGINPFTKQNPFVIVSCSSLIPLKRVDMIASSLKNLDFPLRWVHFGGGVELEKIAAIVKEFPDNVECDLKGVVKNQYILQYYARNPVNLFINLSTVEGLPVSIMEAISFGIPILATDVGGVKEIVTDKTGVLISERCQAHEVTREIRKFKNSNKNSLKFREQVRRFWEENFNAEMNYNNFIKRIKSN